MIPVFVLHCSELPERTLMCRAHLGERLVQATYWRGIHGKTWGLQTVLEFDPGQHLPPGHVGLNLGTWNLWQHIALSKTDDVVCILEDDAVLPPNFYAEVDKVQRQLDRDMPDWDLCFLGLAEAQPHVWNKVTERVGPPDSRLCKMNDPFGTHAYIVKRRALPILLDNMAVAHRNLDQQLWARVLKPGLLKWCAVLPSLITQRTFDYVGSGKPEWTPSCIDDAPAYVPQPNSAPLKMFTVTETEAKQFASGGSSNVPPIPQSELITLTTAMIDRFPCIYRGESLEEDGINTHGRSVPINQCARLNTPCHDRPVSLSGSVKMYSGFSVTDCESCQYRKEMALNSVRERLPLPDGHFNPSMLMWNGKLIFATRDSWGHSKVALWELTNSKSDWAGEWKVKAIGSFATDHAEASRLEDPRLFIATNKDSGAKNLCVAFNLPDGYPPKRVQVGFVRFNGDLTGITDTEVFRSPLNSLYEKNWSPFEDEDGLHWVYSMKPEHMVLGQSNWSTPNNLPWTGGFMRGGAAPVFVPSDVPGEHGGKYYVFFHGCLKRVEGNIYTTGVYTFERHAPYQILKQSTVPLLWPDLPAQGENVVKRYVWWVGGAVLHAGAWHLAIGVDDSFSRIVRIPVEDVEKALSDVPETDRDRTTSLRNTVISKGTGGDNARS